MQEILISPELLRLHNIPVVKLVQYPGEFVINYPGAYHSGFNHGYNCAESTNFATSSWLPIGALARSCDCRSDSVQIQVGHQHVIATATFLKLTSSAIVVYRGKLLSLGPAGTSCCACIAIRAHAYHAANICVLCWAVLLSSDCIDHCSRLLAQHRQHLHCTDVAVPGCGQPQAPPGHHGCHVIRG